MTDWTEIEEARAKAHAKHGADSIEGITAADSRWLSILVEEGGETSEVTLLAWNALLQARIGAVAHEQTYDATGSLRGELVDVLAVASAWLDALDNNRADISQPRGPRINPANGDILCPQDGEWVNQRCYRCGLRRPAIEAWWAAADAEGASRG